MLKKFIHKKTRENKNSQFDHEKNGRQSPLRGADRGSRYSMTS